MKADLRSGNYIVRAEIIALNMADKASSEGYSMGAQFFPNCGMITLNNVKGGKKFPTNTMAIPGIYNATDPSLLLANGMKKTFAKDYKVPGPKEFAPPTAVPQPPANRLKGSYHWMNERAVSLISLPLLATAFVYGSHPINDMLMGVVLPVQVYMSFEQVLTDYFHRRRWPVVSRVLKGLLVVMAGLAMFGAWRINTTDVGLTNYCSRLWNAAKNRKEEMEKKEE
ncbi:membrane anchor subunit of succinate dehydrogenase, Sdh4 [Coemansia sp. BCRC 34301]|nr:membrane anchor subunit of succinate dehydrogenase, Sdh4 [Coemansia sp. BCRC 34301]